MAERTPLGQRFRYAITFVLVLLLLGHGVIFDNGGWFLTVLTVVPVLVLMAERWIPRLATSKRLASLVDQLVLAGPVFVVGYYFSSIAPRAALGPLPGWWYWSFSALVLVVAVPFLIWLLDQGVYEVDRQHAKTTQMIEALRERSGVSDWDRLLDRLHDDQANKLLVTGNLISLTTDEGVRLLLQFLRKHNANEVMLIVPRDAEARLARLRERITSGNLRQRIKYQIYEPYWHIPGVLIAGKQTPHLNWELEPRYAFFYRIMHTEKDDFSKGGVLTDMTTGTISDLYKEAWKANYFAMRERKFLQDPFTVEHVWTKAGDQAYRAPIKDGDLSTFRLA